MPRQPDRNIADGVTPGLAALLALTVCAAAHSAGPTPEPRRFAAPITIERPAPFVRIALPPAVYAHAAHADLRDLQVVDARGERVPFALLPARSATAGTERSREAVLYALPSRPSADGAWVSPVEVVVEGERITVRRRGTSNGKSILSATMGSSPSATRGAGGWLVDLGETRPGDAAATSLQLAWSGPADFSVGYRLETSADLQRWRPAGSGQLMALQSAAGGLSQRVVTLPEGGARFVRLVWSDPSEAPQLTGATALASEPLRTKLDNPAELTLSPSTEPTSPTGGTATGLSTTPSTDDDARRGLAFDLGAALPIVDIALRFDSGTRVAPVRVQGRERADSPWRELGSGVFYRLARDRVVDEAPALAIPATARYLRLVPDPRAAALPAEGTRLVVHAALASLLFAQQGTPPFRLLAGARTATDSALPLTTLVPLIADEQPRFGRAGVGAFEADEAAVRAADSDERAARWRPWWLWGVLLIGVALLGGLVWRLASTRPASPR